MGTPNAALPEGSDGKRLSYIRVTSVEIAIDPETLDRLFVVHSEESEPVALAVSAVDLQSILLDLARAVLRSMN